MRAWIAGLVGWVGCVEPEPAGGRGDAATLPASVAPPPASFTLAAGNFVAGAPSTLTFTGAPSLAVVRFAYGQEGLAPGPCPAGLSGGCLGIGASAQLMALTVVADAGGAGALSFSPPSGAASLDVGLQAVVTGANPALSNPVSRVVGPVGTVVTSGDDRDLDGYTPAQGDCADFDAMIRPGAPDVVGDGRDADCDDVDGVDADGDGVASGPDCDDADAAVFPGAVDTCDGADEDCDGVADASARGPSCGRVETFVGGVTVADVLFVVDNSGSMAEEQGRLQAATPRLFDPIVAAQADVHVGVVTTDMDDPSQAGRLQAAFGLIYSDGVAMDYRAWFVEAVSQGTGGSPDERGLAASFAALSPPLITAENAGFLRRAAELHVVFVTDEDDDSAASPAVWSALFSRSKAWPFRSLAHGLIGPARGCREAVDGARYRAVIAAAGGVRASVCATDYGPFFDDLATEVLAGPRRTVFELLDRPDPGTMEVRVDLPGVGVVTLAPGDWIYDATANTVRITSIGLPAGALVMVEYDL